MSSFPSSNIFKSVSLSLTFSLTNKVGQHAYIPANAYISLLHPIYCFYGSEQTNWWEGMATCIDQSLYTGVNGSFPFPLYLFHTQQDSRHVRFLTCGHNSSVDDVVGS